MTYIEKLIKDTKIIKLEKVKFNYPFVTYKTTLKLQNFQMTFLYLEYVDVEISIISILYFAVEKYIEISRNTSFNNCIKTYNHLSNEDKEKAVQDYRNSLKIYNGLGRLYGRDINKLINFIKY